MSEILAAVKGLKAFKDSAAVDFEGREGEIVCLFGMNGSGKTALVKILCGVCKPYEGKEEINVPLEERGVCLQFPEHLVFNEEAVAEARLITGDENSARELLEEIGVSPAQSPLFMSDGQKRLLFLYGFMKTKKLLIFDEPFASLDEETKIMTARKMREASKEGKCVIYTANREADTEIASKIIFITKENSLFSRQ